MTDKLYISIPFPDYEYYMEKHSEDWSERTSLDTSTDGNVMIPLEWYIVNGSQQRTEEILMTLFNNSLLL